MDEPINSKNPNNIKHFNFFKYLNENKTNKEKNIFMTHTSMSNKYCGSYHIPDDDLENFYESYSNTLYNNMELNITEKKTPEKGIFTIDLDFRENVDVRHNNNNSNDTIELNTDMSEITELNFNVNKNDDINSINNINDINKDKIKLKRKYKLEDIINLCDNITDILKTFIEYNIDIEKTIFDYYIFERPKPRIDKDKIKDGVHIIFPNINVSYKLYHYIRYKCLENKLYDIFTKYNYINSNEDIFDEAVIEKNNWLMYGSTKPDISPYILTYSNTENKKEKKIIKHLKKYFKKQNTKENHNNDENNEENKDDNNNDNKKSKNKITFQDTLYLVKKFSLRNKKDITTKIKEDLISKLDEISNSNNKVSSYKNKESTSILTSSKVEQSIIELVNENAYIWPEQNLSIIDNIQTKLCGNSCHYFVRLGHPNPDEKVICPFKGEPHNRASCPVYLHISKEGIVMRCNDSGNECEGKKYPSEHVPIPSSYRNIIFNSVTIVNNYKVEGEPEFDKKYFEHDLIEILPSSELNYLLIQGLSRTHNDIAKLLYALYKETYIYSASRWYEYVGHKWSEKKNPSIKQKISDELKDYYDKLKDHYSKTDKNNTNKNKTNKSKTSKNKTDKSKTGKDHNPDNNPDNNPNNNPNNNPDNNPDNNPESKNDKNENNSSNEDDLEEKLKIINSLASKLRDAPYKKNVMSECEYFFGKEYENFVTMTDEKKHLLCFNNGVYDFELMEFRDGTKEDLLTFTTRCDYKEYSEEDEDYKDVSEFIYRLLPNDEKREYTLKLISSCLVGHTSDEKFHIWTGTASNGKSKFTELITNSLGDYAFSLPISLITQKRQAATSANPEMAKTKGKRFGYMQEPDKGDEIKVGLMKELTGGDIISTRRLYGEPFDFKPQFKLILCCNDLPKIPSSDQGTWRRLRVIEFTSKFTDNPDPNNPNEFKKDTKVAEKINNWRSAFLFMLIKYYKKYKEEGLVEPEEIMKYTKEYESISNKYEDFINECITKNPKDALKWSDLHHAYITWFKNNRDDKVDGIKEIKKYFEVKFGSTIKPVRNESGVTVKGWKGYSLKLDNDDDEIDEDDD